MHIQLPSKSFRADTQRQWPRGVRGPPDHREPQPPPTQLLHEVCLSRPAPWSSAPNPPACPQRPPWVLRHEPNAHASPLAPVPVSLLQRFRGGAGAKPDVRHGRLGASGRGAATWRSGWSTSRWIAMRTRSRWVRTWIARSIIGGGVVRSTVKLVAKPPSLLGLIAVLSSLLLARVVCLMHLPFARSPAGSASCP